MCVYLNIKNYLHNLHINVETYFHNIFLKNARLALFSATSENNIVLFPSKREWREIETHPQINNGLAQLA